MIRWLITYERRDVKRGARRRRTEIIDVDPIVWLESQEKEVVVLLVAAFETFST